MNTESDRRKEAALAADFSKPGDYPLVKNKVSPFNSGYVSEERWLRDLYMADELNIDSFRYEIGWGYGQKISLDDDHYAFSHEVGAPQISGTPEHLEYHFDGLDHITDALNAGGMRPMYVHAYTPDVLSSDGTMISKPSDMEKWKEINASFAAHWRETGRRIGSYEIWNEPDLSGVFFSGTRDEYFEIYRYGALGVRSADPDAKVGGPALSFREDWGEAFLDYVEANHLPLDFYSYHKYSRPEDTHPVYRSHIDGRFPTTEIILSEYASYTPGVQYPDFHQDGAVDTHRAACMLLHDFRYFMSLPDVSKVYWAQFNDPEVYGETVDRCGIVSIDGRRKAVFNAYRIFADMPADRKRFTSEDGAIEGMASADSHKAAAVFWNMSETDRQCRLTLSGIPFRNGRMKVYRIDAEHANYNVNPDTEQLEVSESGSCGSESDRTWSGIVPAMGVVYVTAEDGSFQVDEAEKHVAEIIRTNHYYPDRKKSNYAEFDEKTWVARLGMVREQDADSLVGVTVEHLPEELQVSCETGGTLQDRNIDSILGIRIDYQVRGSYVKSVLFHGGLYHAERNGSLPWGTQAPANQVIEVPDFSSFRIVPSDFAPEGWENGRAILSFELQNAGAGAAAKFALNQEPGTARKLTAWYGAGEGSDAYRSSDVRIREDAEAADEKTGEDVDAADGDRFLRDRTGNGLDARMHGGVSLTGGLLGKALAFNGTDAYLTMPCRVRDDLTVSFWMKTEQGKGAAVPGSGPDGADGSGFSPEDVCLLDVAGTGTAGFRIGLLHGKLTFRVGESESGSRNAESRVGESESGSRNAESRPGKQVSGAGGQGGVICSLPAVNDGTWHHCTCTGSRKTGTIRIYVDGRPEASGTGGTVRFDAEEMRAGQRPDGTGCYNGLLEDLRIYNYVIPEGLETELSGLKFLSGRYHFENISGDLTPDASDRHNDMRLHGGSRFQSGREGSALSLSGDGYGTITRNIADDFTIGFRMKTTWKAEEGTQWKDGAGIVDGTCQGEAEDFGVSLTGDRLAFGTGDPDTTIVSKTPVSDGKWHFCAVTRRRPDGRMRLYVDGVLEAEGTGGRKSLYAPLELEIGRTRGSRPQYFHGLLADLTILNRALSPGEAAAFSRGTLVYE